MKKNPLLALESLGQSINVNITLLFGLPRYRQVAEAYLAGLESLAAQRKPLSPVASVASFFLSRIDVLVDRLLEEIMAMGQPEIEEATKLHGRVAIASAKFGLALWARCFGCWRRFSRPSLY